MLLPETLSGNALLKYRPQVTYPPPSTTVFSYVTNGTITVPAGVTLAIAPQVVVKVYSGSPAFTHQRHAERERPRQRGKSDRLHFVQR